MALSPASHAVFPLAALSSEPSSSPSASQATSDAWRRVVSNPFGSSARWSWMRSSSCLTTAGLSRRFQRSSQVAIQSAEAPGRSWARGPKGTISGGICRPDGTWSVGRGGPGGWPCATAAEAAASTATALRHARPIGVLRETLRSYHWPKGAGNGSPQPRGPAALARSGACGGRSAVREIADVPDVVGLERARTGEAHRRAVGILDQVESLTGRAVDGGARAVDAHAQVLQAGRAREQLDLLGNADHRGEPAQRAARVVAAHARRQSLEGGGHLHVAPPGHLPVAERLALGGAVGHAERERRGARAPLLAGLLGRRLVAARLAGAVRAHSRLAGPVL